MSVSTALTRMWSSMVGKAVEGGYRPGPYALPISGGFLPANAPWNWWQTGINIEPFSAQSAMLEACVSAYSQTLAMCPGDHWRSNDKGGRDRVTNSALSRILRVPNDYQSISDFILNAVRQLYLDGNSYAYCVRNSRYEIDEIHLMDPRLCWPQVSTTGEIFYTLGGNHIIGNRLPEVLREPIPARDVLHIRLHTNLQRAYPLIGQSPILAAMSDIIAIDSVKQQQIAFFKNQAQPSYILSTDLILDKDQVQAARDRWNEVTRGLGAGGTPILTGGLKPIPTQMRARDAQIAEILSMSNQNIALVFRIPFQLLGLGTGNRSSTEALMQEWVASGLGFCANHVEEAFGQTFKLWGQPDEYVEFNTAALLRSAFKDRITAMKEGVLGGIFAPNEARNMEGLNDVPFGDSPRVQQQMVPLQAAGAIPMGSSPPGKTIISPAPSPPSAPSAPSAPPAQLEGTSSQRGPPDARRTDIAKGFLERSRKYERRANL